MTAVLSEGLATATHDALALLSEMAKSGRTSPLDGSVLAASIYGRCHCRPAKEQIIQGNIVADIAEACDTSPRVDFGWTVRDIAPHQQRLIAKGDTTYLVSPGDFVDELGPGASSRRGMAAGLFMPATTVSLQHGYLYAFGNHREGLPRAYPRVRFYWNVDAESCVALVGGLTRHLNRVGLPFRLKCGTLPSTLARADSLVLFVARRHVDVALAAVKTIHEEHVHNLSRPTPLFAKPLDDGLAIADDVDDDTSFGMARSRLLAEALLDGARSEETVAAHFVAHHVDPLRPHLRRVEVNDYELPTGRERHGRRSSSTQSLLLAEVEHLAGRLCREALFDGDRCTWMTPSLGGQGVVSAAGPGLYEGTSGIALFLAAAHRLTGEAAFARVAEAAARQTVARCEAFNGDPWGRHGGQAGIALAMASTGRLLDDARWISASEAMAHRVAALDPAGATLDVVSGLAGTVGALAELAVTLEDEHFMDHAYRFAKDLVSRCTLRDGRASWCTLPQLGAAQVDLLGAAHGTSGIAASLLPVAVARADDELMSAARQALAYERWWAERCDGLWPDLRGVTSLDSTGLLGCGGTWCHGSAGAGLARVSLLAAADSIENGPDLLAAAERAAEHAELSLRAGADSTPCHGLAGAGELWLELGRITGKTHYVERALTLAKTRVAQQGGLYGQWGCGIPDAGSVPGLMVGRAGIGMFLARCVDPAVVSSPLVV